VSCDHVHLDGSYVLGSLPASERTEFERHLAGCDECARRVRELAGLPGLLARVPVDVLDADREDEPVPPTLLPAALAEVRRRRRRRRAAAVAAAAAVVLGGVGATALLTGDDPGPAPPAASPTSAPAEQMTSAVPEAISGWVSLTEVGWGTRIDLDCTYDGGYGGGYGGGERTYVMRVRTVDGDVQEVGTWRATSGETHVSMATSAAPDEIASVVVETGAGLPVLRLAP
jgi:hypothetical protein